MTTNGVDLPTGSSPTLPVVLDDFVHSLVTAGHFQSSEEVIAEALLRFRDLWETNEIKLNRLKTAIQVGIDEAERGDLIDARAAMAQLRAKFTSVASL